MLKVSNIMLDESGTTINYEYSFDGKCSKYFRKDNLFYSKYDYDLKSVPESILIIPLLSNIMPIAWFAGFDVEILEVDEDFYNALKDIKVEFSKQFPNKKLKGNLIAKKLTKNIIEGNNSAMLFSGGVDAYATYIRNFESKPDLVTILGADIEIQDKTQWHNFTNFLENESLLINNKKVYIETNVRDFYTYHIELLLDDIGWWGLVQHGLSLIGSIAPLSYINNYKNIYIASSYTKDIDIAWGSTPQVDEKITWGGIKVFHDGYELKRQDKVDLIANFATKTNNQFKLRVCYSELRNGFNCSNCEKCFRTILGLILNGKDPNLFGFNVDKDVYHKMFKVLNEYGASKGMQYFWWELLEKAKSTNSIFYFSDNLKEDEQLNRIKRGELHALMDSKIKNPNYTYQKFKFILRHKYPWVKNIYKKIKL